MDNTIAIRLEGVSKRYTIHHEKPTLVEKLIKEKDETFYALKDIDLEIKRGLKIGIIGPNGSGKTTLLKVIAGITQPTTGRVETNGKIVSLIDLEAGFQPDLTGVQNIFLNGMLMGMTKKEISEKLASIVQFADIGQFIDVPLFTYSDGMKFRLGFSVAVNADPDVLILDEGIGTGDSEFQKRSQAKIQEFFKEGTTVIVVTHWLDFIRRNCHRIILVENGRIVRDGSKKVLSFYQKN